MNLYEKCLQFVEENRTNPLSDFFYITICLQHWYNRKQIYSTMGYQTDFKKIFEHWFGDDTTIERLITERNLPLQHLLKLVTEVQKIEREMRDRNSYAQIYLVLPMLDQLIINFLPIWKAEVKKLDIKKDHPDIKTILSFTFNLRPHNKTDVIDFALKLLREEE